MRLREILIEELRAERANAEDLRQNCTRVVAENGRLRALSQNNAISWDAIVRERNALRAAARKFLDEQTAENARTLRKALEQTTGPTERDVEALGYTAARMGEQSEREAK